MKERIKFISWINKNTLKFQFLSLIILLLNLFLVIKLKKITIDIFDLCKTIIGVQLFFGLLTFLIKKWICFASDFPIYFLSPSLSKIGVVLLMCLLGISLPFMWFMEYPYQVFIFCIPWGIIIYSYSAEE